MEQLPVDQLSDESPVGLLLRYRNWLGDRWHGATEALFVVFDGGIYRHKGLDSVETDLMKGIERTPNLSAGAVTGKSVVLKVAVIPFSAKVAQANAWSRTGGWIELWN